MVDRINELKESLIFRHKYRDNNPPEPHWFFLEGFAAHIDDPFEVREAKARRHFYTYMPIQIHPGEAIVGQVDWNEPLANSIANTHVREDVLARIRQSDLPEATKSKIDAMIDAVRPFCFDIYGSGILTDAEKLVHECALAPSTFFNGHMVPAFDYLLERGLDGILADIRHHRNRPSTEDNAPLTQEQEHFYDAMEITVEGISIWFSRYAALAQRLLDESAPSYHTEQLMAVRDTCTRLTHEPAQTYPEALQMMWFFMALTDYDSFGRTDQYLYPYFRYSRDRGMTPEDAMLWTKYMLIKAEECGGILNMTMGGVLKDGSSAVNELTLMVMQAVRENGFRSPNLTLRLTA